jgi:DNA-binding FadR family transcriptional regulator
MGKVMASKNALSAEVANKLRKMIARQNMKAGDRLPNETELGIMFGISRSTVREAIKLLLAANVVEIQRGKGTFVTVQPGVARDPLGLEFANRSKLLDNLMETRMMFEPEIAALAAQRADKDNLDKLAHIIQKIREAGSDKDNQTSLDVEFHTAVAECTKNDVLYRIVPIICESIQEGSLETTDVPGSYERAIQSHINIYHGIWNRDPETTKEEMAKHIRQTREDIRMKVNT